MFVIVTKNHSSKGEGRDDEILYCNIKRLRIVLHLQNRYTHIYTDVHTRVINMTNMRTFYVDRHGKNFAHYNF